MHRLRIITLLAVASLLLAIPSPAASASLAETGAERARPVANSDVTSISARTAPRLSVRQVRRALPRPAAFARRTTRRFVSGDFITLCGARSLVGQAPVSAAGAIYDRGDLLSFMGVEEHTDTSAANQRFNAAKRQIRQSCDGQVVAGLRQERKRTQPVRRIGEQNWVRGYALRDVNDGRVYGEYLVNVYRVGRFVVFADVLGGSIDQPTVARRPLQRPFRQLGNGVNRLPQRPTAPPPPPPDPCPARGEVGATKTLVTTGGQSISFRLDCLSDPAPPSRLGRPGPERRLVAVALAITNQGDRRFTACSDNSVRLFDTGDLPYRPSIFETNLGSDLGCTTVLPGETKTRWVTFAMPNTRTPGLLRFEECCFFGGDEPLVEWVL